MIRTTRTLATLAATAVLTSLATALPADAEDVTVTPLRTIGGPSNAQMVAPLGVSVTGAGRTFVANYSKSTIAVFAPGAAGDVPPEREIGGATTTLAGPRYLDVDSAGFVWVSNGNNVAAFGPSASGNTAPAANFATGMATFGLAVSDAKVFVSSGGTMIKRFPTSASGPASVERTLTSATLVNARGMDTDSAGRLWVANGNGKNVLAFDRDADGSASPLRSIKGPNTGIQYASDVAVDPAGRIYVVDEFAKTIRVFAPDANGDVAPIKVIGGPSAGLGVPAGIDIGQDNQIVVANYAGNSISVFGSLFPTPAPAVTTASSVQRLRVSGGPKAKVRKIVWKAPASTGGAPVTSYRVVVKKGSKVLKRVTVGGTTHSVKIKRSALRRGKLTVVITAGNAAGWGAPSTKTFRVKK